MQATLQLKNPLLLIVRTKFLGVIRKLRGTVAFQLLRKVFNLLLKVLVRLEKLPLVAIVA